MKSGTETTCEAVRRDMLLARSGELDANGQARLRAHLAACAACRQYGGDVERILELSAAAVPSGPSEQVLRTLRAAARQEAAARTPIPFRKPVYRLAALAALWAIVIGSILIFFDRNAETDRIRNLSAMAGLLATEEIAADAQPVGEDLRALAKQLLALEGLDDEDVFTDAEALFEAHPPTTSQSHSSRASRAERCV